MGLPSEVTVKHLSFEKFKMAAAAAILKDR